MLEYDFHPSGSRETSPEQDENEANLASVGQDHGEGKWYYVFIMYWKQCNFSLTSSSHLTFAADKSNHTASEETEGSPSVRRSVSCMSF